MNNLKNLFSIEYPTVQLHSDCKIIGPVLLPIKVARQNKNQTKAFLFSGKEGNYLICLFGKVENSKDVLIRVSSACVFGFHLNSLLCDCKDQFDEAVTRMIDNDAGILIFAIDQHGKGVGLEAHFLVYAEGQRRGKGLFTEIYQDLGLNLDYRNYDEIVSIIEYFTTLNHIKKITMLTESPEKRAYFQEQCDQIGLQISFDLFNTDVTPENKAELTEKVALGYEINKLNVA